MATDKKKIFCSVLKDFLNDVYNSYPDASLLIFMNLTDALIATNPAQVVSRFMDYVGPVKDKIKQKDETFFINGGLSKQISSEYSFLNDEIDKILNIWKDPQTPQKTKDVIWRYFQVLVKIGESIEKKSV